MAPIFSPSTGRPLGGHTVSYKCWLQCPLINLIKTKIKSTIKTLPLKKTVKQTDLLFYPDVFFLLLFSHLFTIIISICLPTLHQCTHACHNPKDLSVALGQ